MIRRPPRSTRTYPLLPYTTLFRSNIVFGVLPNGMKYALLKNSTPKGSVVIRTRFDVGSFAEADDQRGLAHFLEHMAFNGSTHVPEGEMIKLLERKGLAFGADTNASTGFDETVYKLDLPGASDDLIDTGRSEEHTSELQSLMRISYAVFCLKKTQQHLTT